MYALLQLSLPIDVSVLPPDEDDENDDYEQLYEATRTLITGYNPVLGKTFRDNADEYSYTTQTQVFSAVRKGAIFLLKCFVDFLYILQVLRMRD